MFNLSQALALIDSGRFKAWRAAKAPGLATSFYGLPVRCSACVQVA